MDEPRVCTECEIPHVENCSECFGWGLHPNGTPISASEAHDWACWEHYKKCEACGGTPRNEHLRLLFRPPNMLHMKAGRGNDGGCRQ